MVMVSLMLVSGDVGEMVQTFVVGIAVWDHKPDGVGGRGVGLVDGLPERARSPSTPRSSRTCRQGSRPGVARGVDGEPRGVSGFGNQQDDRQRRRHRQAEAKNPRRPE